VINLKNRIFSQRGLSLLETIVAITLMGLIINGILVAWVFTETQQSGLEEYWQARSSLDLAYETVVRSLRDQARASTVAAISSPGAGISFTGTDGTIWQFYRSGNSFMRTTVSAGPITKTDTLIADICNNATFSIAGNPKITVTLSVIKPGEWTGTDNLTLTGTALVRNP
jgi:hypothetical protein